MVDIFLRYQLKPNAFISACFVLSLGCAVRNGSPVKQAVEPKTLTQETAVAFVEECVKGWSKKDLAVWDKVVDGAFLPTGTVPSLLLDEQQTSNNLWTKSIPPLTEWMSTHKVSQVAPGLRLIEGIKSSEVRDLRHLSLEQLRGKPNPELVIPRVQVQTLTLGLDMDGNGAISSKEKTRVHLYQGVLYWEPFGW